MRNKLFLIIPIVVSSLISGYLLIKFPVVTGIGIVLFLIVLGRSTIFTKKYDKEVDDLARKIQDEEERK